MIDIYMLVYLKRSIIFIVLYNTFKITSNTAIKIGHIHFIPYSQKKLYFELAYDKKIAIYQVILIKFTK
jgi:hypothetical protein